MDLLRIKQERLFQEEDALFTSMSVGLFHSGGRCFAHRGVSKYYTTDLEAHDMNVLTHVIKNIHITSERSTSGTTPDNRPWIPDFEQD